jgi:hypothetical protein
VWLGIQEFTGKEEGMQAIMFRAQCFAVSDNVERVGAGELSDGGSWEQFAFVGVRIRLVGGLDNVDDDVSLRPGCG